MLGAGTDRVLNKSFEVRQAFEEEPTKDES